MECHDVQQLLAFVNRKSEDLDAAERAALREHLDKCPDCSARNQAEQRADETLGVLMRDVPVPAGLKQQVVKRLGAERGAARWKTVKRGALTAAAAAVLLALVGGYVWQARLPTEITEADVGTALVLVTNSGFWDENSAKQYLKENGLPDHVPQQFDYRLLQSVEPVYFKGRRVAKLTFAKGNDVASVLVLPSEQFRTNQLTEDPTCLNIVPEREHGIIYLILFRGNLGALQRPAQINV
jgi:hypothetical protein